MSENDLVSDILQRIVEKRIKLSPKAKRDIEEEVRRDWGGERHYIAKVGECGRIRLSERDQRIRDEHRRGEHEKLLARRWGISPRRVRQIVNAVECATTEAIAAANDDDRQTGNGLP